MLVYAGKKIFKEKLEEKICTGTIFFSVEPLCVRIIPSTKRNYEEEACRRCHCGLEDDILVMKILIPCVIICTVNAHNHLE